MSELLLKLSQIENWKIILYALSGLLFIGVFAVLLGFAISFKEDYLRENSDDTKDSRDQSEDFPTQQ